jgi:putative chitinase
MSQFLITNDQLRRIISPVKYSVAQLEKITDALNQTLIKYEINTPKRICHFLAQVIHESGTFRYTVELWGPTPAQKRYDTRVDLGNTPALDNDGFKYRGRGWIQVTGKFNYQLASKEFGYDFVKDPDKLSHFPFAALTAGWFWKKKKLNTLADGDQITNITKVINGGFNGLDDRKLWWAKARKVMIG